jgi:Leucine-rich repeat (LRR) protein
MASISSKALQFYFPQNASEYESKSNAAAYAPSSQANFGTRCVIPLAAAPTIPVFHISLLEGPEHKKNDDNLMLIWPRIVRSLRFAGVAINPAKMPRTLLQIKAWLIFHAGDIAKMKLLDLSGLGLTAIPKEFLQLHFRGLEILNLGRNNLDEIPPKLLENCPSLRLLFWDDNKFRAIPKEVEEASYRLAHVDFQGNEGLTNHPFVRMRLIFEKAMASPSVKSIYEKIIQNGSWRISIEDFEEPFEARCSLELRSILLKGGYSNDRILNHLIFELINASCKEEILALNQKVLRGEMDRESYAKETERVEHRNTLLHHEICLEAIAKLGWDPSVDVYKVMFKDFEAYWNLAKHTHHAEMYRLRFDALAASVAVKGGS